MPAQPKISSALAQFSGNWDDLAATMQREVSRGLKAGLTASAATSRAFSIAGVNGKMEDWIMEGVVGSLKKGGIEIVTDPKGLRKFWLNKTWPGDGLSLSKQISSPAMRNAVTRTIQNSMREGKSWTSLAKSLTDAKLVKADVAGHTWDLIKQARRANGGDAAAVKAYQTAVRSSQRQIERLARAGAPTSRLKKAYANVIKATESGSKEALNKAIGRAVNAKARYNAERIARTEMARAYGEGVRQDAEGDPDAKGIRSELSSRHPKTDICDFHAEVDQWDMGEGVSPVDEGPPYPYHPHCTCNLNIVYTLPEGTVPRTTPNRKAGAKYLAKQSKADQKAMLGAKGAERFSKAQGSWEKNLKHWKGTGGPDLAKMPDGLTVPRSEVRTAKRWTTERLLERKYTDPELLGAFKEKHGWDFGQSSLNTLRTALNEGKRTRHGFPIPKTPVIAIGGKGGVTVVPKAVIAKKIPTKKVPTKKAPAAAPVSDDATVTSLTKAKSIKEIEHIMHQKHPGQVFDFIGADLVAAKETAIQFATLSGRYSKFTNGIDYIGTYQAAGRYKNLSSFGSTTWAHATKNGRIIGLNPKSYGKHLSFKRRLRSAERMGFHPEGCNSIGSVITHEVGHHIHNFVKAANHLPALRTKVRLWLTDKNSIRSTVVRDVSSYAAKSTSELFAELFSSYIHQPAHLWNPTQKSFAILIEEILKEAT